jgi:hypothetical protein
MKPSIVLVIESLCEFGKMYVKLYHLISSNKISLCIPPNTHFSF